MLILIKLNGTIVNSTVIVEGGLKMNNKNKDILIIGFALFAMFFGAGNLIFPPYLGHAIGSEYIIGMIYNNRGRITTISYIILFKRGWNL